MTASTTDTPTLADLVSPTDLRVITLLAGGVSHIEVAELLGCQRQAIDTRVWRLRCRIGATTTAHAVALLAQAGVLDLTQITPRTTSTGGIR